MEPIVSPWFIYLIGIADGALDTWGTLGAILTVAMFFTFCAIWSDAIDEIKGHKRPWRLAIPIVVVIGWWMMFMLIPSSKTLIGMAVAQNITQDRVVKTGKIIYAAKDDLKKDIIDIMSAINKESK